MYHHFTNATSFIFNLIILLEIKKYSKYHSNMQTLFTNFIADNDVFGYSVWQWQVCKILKNVMLPINLFQNSLFYGVIECHFALFNVIYFFGTFSVALNLHMLKQPSKGVTLNALSPSMIPGVLMGPGGGGGGHSVMWPIQNCHRTAYGFWPFCPEQGTFVLNKVRFSYRL